MLRFPLALLLLVVPLLALGQEKPKADAIKQNVPGYTVKKIEGFTVLLSDETVKQDRDSVLERKPLAVLERELKALAALCPAKILTALHNVPVWVEWDEKHEMPNGRDGYALAWYNGGHQLNMLQQGSNPAKAKCVVVLRMAALTAEHQPMTDRGRCVMLHEMVHAVHIEVLGRNNAGINAAYKQALERKLLDPKVYAATNEMEFFAEMTCAYFDQLHYYPNTREDLKKHDPVTFKLMESIWGKAPVAAGAPRQYTLVSAAPPLAKAPLGSQLGGLPLTRESLLGSPVLLVYWATISQASMFCLPKLNGWNDEMGELGLKTVAIHLTGSTKSDIVAAAKARQLRVPLFEAPARKGEIINDPKEFPVALVYNHEGNCIYKGSALDAETPARQAVATALITKAGIEKPSAGLAPVIEALRAGKPALAQMAKLNALTFSSEAAVKEQAKALYEAIAEGPQLTLADATDLAESNPVEAYLKAERLSIALKDTPLGAQASTLIAKLKQNKAVATEVKARAELAKVKKLDTDLSSRAGSFNPAAPEFQSKNAAAIKQLTDAVQQMKKSYPTAKATEEALAIAVQYGIQVR